MVQRLRGGRFSFAVRGMEYAAKTAQIRVVRAFVIRLGLAGFRKSPSEWLKSFLFTMEMSTKKAAPW